MANSVPREQLNEQRTRGVVERKNERMIREPDATGDRTTPEWMAASRTDDGGAVSHVETASADEDGMKADSATVAEDAGMSKTAGDGMVAAPDSEDAVTTARGGANDENGLGTSPKTARRQLLDQVAAGMDEGDDERARRYVATVRPAMAAMRYASTYSRHAAEDLADTVIGEVLRTGEGEVLSTGEGGAPQHAGHDGIAASVATAPVMADSSTVNDGDKSSACLGLGEELDDDAVAQLGGIAQVRLARKDVRKRAKAERAQRALQRRAQNMVEDDVRMLVKVLDSAERLKR